MKCKNCGGEIRLEDMYCPYCGSPNEEAQKHARDMQQYRQEFQKTKEDVIERAGRQTKRAVRFAAAALLLAAIGVNIFLQVSSYSLIRSIKQSGQKKNAPVYRARIEEYLEAEDYLGFSSYCSNLNLSMYDRPFEEYYVTYRVATAYRYAVTEIMQLINHSRYQGVDHSIKYTSEYLQDFYEALDPEKYSYNSNYNTLAAQEHLDKMTRSIEALCVAYLSMTPEEARSLGSISRGKRIILIEEGLRQYEEAGAQEEETAAAGTVQAAESVEAEQAAQTAGTADAAQTAETTEAEQAAQTAGTAGAAETAGTVEAAQTAQTAETGQPGE